MNTTSISFVQVISKGINPLLFCLLIIIITLTASSNLFIVIVVAKDKAMQTFINALYVSIALSDMIVGKYAMLNFIS
jgi:hypothetical protein